MMKNKIPVTYTCKVISIEDDLNGGRIKARLSPVDDHVLDIDLPYAFPLIPKMLHIKPKVGETVEIICADANNPHSERFYIGPVISQPQHMYMDPFDFSSRSLFRGSVKTPDPNIDMDANTHGALPEDDDIALVGRTDADIILKDEEVRIRCGVRRTNGINKDKVSFNRLDPAYIKLKYNENGATYTDNNTNEKQEYKSTVTIAADRVNLLGHDSDTPFNLTDKNDLVSDEEMTKILETAHVLPYGDTLVEFLKLFVKVFAEHTHPIGNLTPCKPDTFRKLISYDFNTLLSKVVRIN